MSYTEPADAVPPILNVSVPEKCQSLKRAALERSRQELSKNVSFGFGIIFVAEYPSFEHWLRVRVILRSLGGIATTFAQATQPNFTLDSVILTKTCSGTRLFVYGTSLSCECSKQSG